MENYSAMIRNTFELCSIRDGQVFFETCLKNAFPTFNFRRLELIRIDRDNLYLEGSSWNHVFEIQKNELDAHPVWKSTAIGSPWARPRTSMCIWTISA